MSERTSVRTDRLPEDLRGDVPCSRCGGDNFPVWWTDSPFWNAVVRSKPLPWMVEQGRPQSDGLMCWTCFVVLAYERGFDVIGWHLSPQTHETVKEDQRRRSVLFNDITEGFAYTMDDDGDGPWLTLSEREAIAQHLWQKGWRRDVRPEDINDRRGRA